MSVHLVEAAHANMEALSRLHGEAFDPSWSAKALQDLLSVQGSYAIVAGPDASPSGFILARVAADESEILTLVVGHAARRLGQGRSLVRAAAAHAERLGARAMFLEVDVANQAARSLYEKLGFSVVGRRTGYYGKSAQIASDALTLRVKLPLPAMGKGGDS